MEYDFLGVGVWVIFYYEVIVLFFVEIGMVQGGNIFSFRVKLILCK